MKEIIIEDRSEKEPTTELRANVPTITLVTNQAPFPSETEVQNGKASSKCFPVPPPLPCGPNCPP